jgi:phosphopantetheinyl transferase
MPVRPSPHAASRLAWARAKPAHAPTAELHVWRADLDSRSWPAADDLPSAERDRAAAILRAGARRRWLASRWALRGVLAHYLGEQPAAIELRFGDRGKPMLAAVGAPLRFNLSHSAELALIAVAVAREVGVDVQRVGPRSLPYYRDWTRREALAKCLGAGLGASLPDRPVALSALDAGPGFAASVAIVGREVPPLRQFVAEPGRELAA